MKFNLQNLLIQILICICISCTALEQGSLAPDFETKLIDGSDFKLSDLRGNYVLIDFWGTWCGPCRKENPKLVSLYNKHKDKEYSDAKKFYVVSIALEKNNRAWKAVSEKYGFNWKHQIVEEAKFVRFSELAMKYNVTDIPAKFFIDPDGKIIPQMSFKEIDVYLESKSK